MTHDTVTYSDTGLLLGRRKLPHLVDGALGPVTSIYTFSLAHDNCAARGTGEESEGSELTD